MGSNSTLNMYDPWYLSTALIILGSLSLIRLTLKSLYVFTQTFLLSGISVSTCYTNLGD